jgi:hypothetical protein
MVIHDHQIDGSNRSVIPLTPFPSIFVNSEEIRIVGSPRSMRTFGPMIFPYPRSSGRMHKVGQSDPLGLIQKSRWPLDRVKMLGV